MADYRPANAFMQGFQQGYGFVDDIYARKRAEARLDQRLREERNQRTWQRERIGAIDAQQQVDRERRRQTEDELRSRQLQYDEANKALASVRPGDYNGAIQALGPYAHLPEVSSKIAEIRDAQQQQTDDRMIAEAGATDPGLAAGAAGIAGGGQQQAPAGPADPGARMRADGSVVYPNAPTPPGDPIAAQAQQLSTEQLEQIAMTNPQEAARIRDEQTARNEQFRSPDQPRLSATGGGLPRYTSEREQQITKARDQRELTRQNWSAQLDINDSSGDLFRSRPPSQQVSAYFNDRSALSKEQQAQGDKMLSGQIDAVIAENKAIVSAPDVDTNSREYKAAKRKLNEAYGLVNARNGYKPLAANGVSAQGLPVGRNRALTDAVLEGSQAQPGNPAPATTAQARAEDRVLERGPQNGRITEAFASAAWRKYKRGQITWPEYESLIRTGRLPTTGETDFKQYDPKDGPVWAITKRIDGSYSWKKIIEGQEDLEYQAARLRNLIEGDAKGSIDKWGEDLAEELGTGKNGSKYTQEFFAMLGTHEAQARARGYDYGNLADVASLWKRYSQLHTISQAIDEELVYRGQYDTSFEETYGLTIEDALFTPLDRTDLDELEAHDSTFMGMGGDPVQLNRLKSYDPGLLSAIRRDYPQYRDLSDQELEAILSTIEER